jgi:hypothetical protein
MALRYFLALIAACSTLLASGGQIGNKIACLNSIVGAERGTGDPGAFSNPQQVALDATSTVVFSAGNAFFRLQADGATAISVAGNATAGHAGDGLSIAQTLFSTPSSIAVMPEGYPILVLDTGNNVVRALWFTNGRTTHWAGNASGAAGFSGDGGPALQATLSTAGPLTSGLIAALAVASDGAVFISDTGNNRIRMVSVDGTMSTVVGNGTAGWAGDSGPGTLAMLNAPGAIATDGLTLVYFFDALNIRLRCYNRVTGVVSHVAGTGASTKNGINLPDGSLASTAMLPASLYGLAVRPSDHALVYMGWYIYAIRGISGGSGPVRGGGAERLCGPVASRALSLPSPSLRPSCATIHYAGRDGVYSRWIWRPGQRRRWRLGDQRKL